MKRKFTKYPSNYVRASNIYSTKTVWYLVDDFVTYKPLTNDNGTKLAFNSKEEAQEYIDKNGIDAVPHQHFEYSVYHPNYRRYNI